MEITQEPASAGLGSWTLRILAALGFIAIIAIGIWGSIKIASSIPKAFSSLSGAVFLSTSTTTPAAKTPVNGGTYNTGTTTSTGTFSNEVISLTTPTSANSGKSFTVSWSHTNKTTDGSYTFRYDCENGTYFTSQGQSGSPVSIYCNVPFNFLNSNNTLVLTPYSKANGTVNVPIYIDFTPNGAPHPTVSGRAMLPIVNAGTPATPATPAYPKPTNPGTTYPVTPTVPVSDPNGYVDLRVRVVSAGIVDRTTGAFTPMAVPSRSQRVAVRFIIENAGTKTSPQFTFGATLPTYPSSSFTSPAESALAPGQSLELTLGFDDMSVYGNNMFMVTVDPANAIQESDKSNNVLQYTITSAP